MDKRAAIGLISWYESNYRVYEEDVEQNASTNQYRVQNDRGLKG